jgi:opacity protein-like surface antigen
MTCRTALRAPLRAALALASVASLGVIAPAALRAQAPTRLLFVAVSGEYERLSTKDASPQQGPGVGVEAGLVIRPWLGAFVGYDAGRLTVKQDEIVDGVDGAALGLSDHTTLRHVELGLRLRLPRAVRLSPYAELGFSARRLHYNSSYRDPFDTEAPAGEVEAEIKGDAPLFGLGVESDLSKSIAFDLGARYTVGKPDEASLTIDGEDFGGLDTSADQPTWRALRVRAGLRWYPTFGGGTR